MKLTQAKTRLGVTFPYLGYEPDDVLTLTQEPAKLSRITEILNLWLGNKTVSVDATDSLAEAIENLGFVRKTETVEKDGEQVEVPTEEHDTNGKFIGCATDALVTGEWTPSGFTLPSGDENHKRKAALAYLQSLANTCGTSEHDGQKCFVPSLERTARKGGLGILPKWALAGATQIINNGSQAKWHEKFTSGYTSASGVAIDPIEHDDFQVKAAHNASADEKEATHQQNVKRLAKCLVEQRRQEEAKRAGEFA